MNNAPTMARPHEYTSLWWPEERIKATLDTKYIISRLRPESVPRLFDLPRWGEGLTSETYMEWIMTKAGRLFLILNEIGIPDRIFALVDESRDDDDLPMAEQNIDLLCLSPYGNDPTLDASFFHTQWRFLVRGISEGEHVAYTANEGVPVEVARAATSSGIQGRDETVDKVVLSGTVCRVFLRTRVQVGGAPHFFSSDEVLEEIRSLRKLAHQHVFSIYASYFVDDTVCVLFTGAETDRTLQSFLSDEPLTFKRLPKEERRQTLITWPHCLVSALSWLHVRGHSHTAIRPSNILVDPDFNIILGQFQALDSLLAPPRVNGLESYQYSAPERWIHTAAAPAHPVQQAPSKVILPSGGRTGRRKKPVRLALAPLNETGSPPSSPDNPRPDSAASKGTVIHLGLPRSPSRFSFAFSSSSSSSAASSNYTSTNSASTGSPKQSSPLWSKRPRSLFPIPSLRSSTSSSSLSSTSSSLVAPPPLDSFNYPPNLALNPNLAIIRRSLLPRRHHSRNSYPPLARNRSAGRGGGMADASFHLARNSVQVQSWIALLEGDALKRCRRDRGSDRFFYAVPRMLIVLRAMLSPEPEKRPSASRVKKCFGAAIREIPSTRGPAVPLHCISAPKQEKSAPIKAWPKEAEVIVEMDKKNNRASMVKRQASVPILTKAKAESVLSSSSVSEFDFGFSEAASDSETNPEELQDGFEDEIDPSILDDFEPIEPVDRVSPQLSLPDLDANITGIEALTFRT
ncbi:hypothetical protein N7509_009078 [Penicillium cosmopolitanum]|uniref:Protein kinase domain-containing protein n=1 Tax=Penicillium cosmopolitanum TaxID=1131564 RepID=A0A9W9VNT4_9EURO|nr:uncharacterized protein N7509_009078 [Penicillium cosmopolitanum]KAJ5386537.1 hypothetical protein N7509_009078 [Penicillium cosmopolitanum]